MSVIVLLVLLAVLVFSLPVVPKRHERWRRWGYYPSGVLLISILAFVALVVLGCIPWGWNF